MRRVIALSACILLLLSGCGADSPDDMRESVIFAMDTIMSIKAYGANAQNALEAAESEIILLENLFSATIPGSDISNINASPTSANAVSAETMELLESAIAISEATEGALDVTVYPLIKAYGFPTGQYAVPNDDEISELLTHVGYRGIALGADALTVTLKDAGMALDLGAVAKGYTSNRLAQLLKERGISSALITLGGNVHALGSKPDGSLWRVAVQDPADSSGIVGVLSVSDMAVITSGAYQRFFEIDGEIIHHIIDPSTGRPAGSGLASVTIIAADGVLADGLSTSLFIMGLDKAASFWRSKEDFEAVFIDSSGKIYITSGLEKIYEPMPGYEDYTVIY